MAQVRGAVSGSATKDRPVAVARELARIDDQIERLVDAVQRGGGEVTGLVERLRRLEQRRGELRIERDRLRVITPVTARQLAELEADLLTCLAERREMCRAQPTQARRLLHDVLVKRMMWTPHSDDRGGLYEFTAECSLGRLVTGVLGQHPMRWWPQRDSNPCFSCVHAFALIINALAVTGGYDPRQD